MTSSYQKKILKIDPVKESLLLAILFFISILLCDAIFYYRTLDVMKEEIKEGILRDTQVISTLVDVEAHKSFNEFTRGDDPLYLKAIAPLTRALNADKQLKYIYTCVMKNDKVYFIMNALQVREDKNSDGKLEPIPQLMSEYSDANKAVIEALKNKKAMVTEEVYQDQWGRFLSAYAPLIDKQGNFIGVLGVDIEVSAYQARLERVWNIVLAGLVVGLFVSAALGYLIYIMRKSAAKVNNSRNQLIKDLVVARKAAESGAKAKEEFLANVSHELRTPMHAILSFSKFGSEDIIDLEESGFSKTDIAKDIKEHFDSINTSGKRLLSLINNLLDLSKLEAGKMELHKVENDIVAMLEMVSLEVRPLIEAKGLSFEIENKFEQKYIIIDKDKITQVLYNLLSNAIKFSPEAGLIKAIIELDNESNNLVITISDSGVGIPIGEEQAVFDKFIQSSKTKSGAGGTGLGLSICKEIVELHGGKIWAKNNDDKGASFSFSIPYVNN